MRALLPENESDRLAALYRYGILDTPPEPNFDRLTRLAARVFDAPISLLTLIDKDRQYFKSHLGFELQESSRDSSICAHAILTDQITMVTDLTADERFADNPFVTGWPQMRWYVAAPLDRADGLRLGTICVIDTRLREAPGTELTSLLQDLADEALEMLELHRVKRQVNSLSDRFLLQKDELEQSRELIHESQQRAFMALEAGNMGYWDRDAKTDLISFSPRLEAMLELDHNTYDGSVAMWLEHVHPDDRQMILDRIGEAQKNERNYTFKYRPITKDGSERWITTTGTYRKDAEGRFAGAHGVSWDSTESEVAARNLRMSEQLFRVLSDSAPIGIFRAELDGQLAYANAKLAESNGATVEEMLGYGWVQFVHPDDKDELLAAIHATNRQSREYEHRLLLRDGRVRWVHARSSILKDQDGNVVGKIGTVDDITQARQLMEDLQRAKLSAEVANRAKDMFLANVSHELRTPLNGVLGVSELLVDAGLNAEQQEMAEIVRDSARGLLIVVNDMLDLSRIEAGRLAIENRPFQLRTTIEQTVSLFKAEAHKRGIVLVTSYAEHLPDDYVGDAGRIRQILTNYLSNAIKFSSGGEVLVQSCGEEGTNSVQVVIAVKDNGVGIDEQGRSKLFKPFSQVDSSTTRRVGGAGLGLAISKRLAELMGGTVGVSSVPGSGSTFWVRVPLTPQEDSEEEEKALPAGHGARADS